jgi:protein SCO1/2
MKPFTVGILGCIAFAMAAGLACGAEREPAGEQVSYEGLMNSPAHPLPDIELTDTAGQPFNIRDKSEDFLTLVYMGFTHCERECPTEMARIAAILSDLPEEARERIRVIFITTDPERDTPEALRTFLDNFNRDFIGLTGSREQAQLGANPASVASTGEHDAEGHEGYAMDHTTFLLVFPQDDGHAHLAYSTDMPSEALASDLARIAVEGWTAGE